MKEIVYHYTDAEGLLGIFRTGCIWASHISYLNDSQEYKYSKALYKETLEVISRDMQLDPVWQQFATAALIYFERRDEVMSPLNNRFSYFISSFSEKDDDLSQWRGYGGTGARFCIGFRTSELSKLEKQYSMAFGEVSYDDEKNSAAAKAMREKFLSVASTLAAKWLEPNGGYTDPSSIHPPEFDKLNNDIVESVATLLKGKAFESEKEWRLYSDAKGNNVSKNELHFRPGRSYLVPYLEVKLCSLENPISSIRVGPTSHPQEALSAVRRMAYFSDKYHLFGGANDGSSIKLSTVSYRDW